MTKSQKILVSLFWFALFVGLAESFFLSSRLNRFCSPPSAASPAPRVRTPIRDTLNRSVIGKSWLDCRLVGVGGCAGARAIPNARLERVVATSDEWIGKRTGIRARRVLGEGESLTDIAANAAREALRSANLKPSDIDLLIFASSTPDDLFGGACAVGARLNLPPCAPCFDLTAACSGFVFALATAAQFAHNRGFARALVVGADALARAVDWTDRNSCILFGDGAGAAVIEHASLREIGRTQKSQNLQNSQNSQNSRNSQIEGTGSDEEVSEILRREKSGVLGFAMHSDGSGGKNLGLKYKPNFAALPKLQKQTSEKTENSEKSEKSEDKNDDENDNLLVDQGEYGKIEMNGPEVYKFAVTKVPEVILETLSNSGLSVGDIDWLCLHQANARILDQVAKTLKIPRERVLGLEDEESEIKNENAKNSGSGQKSGEKNGGSGENEKNKSDCDKLNGGSVNGDTDEESGGVCGDLRSLGNTSAASVPLSLAAAVRAGRVKPGDLLMLAGFGAGLSWGAALVRWDGGGEQLVEKATS